MVKIEVFDGQKIGKIRQFKHGHYFVIFSQTTGQTYHLSALEKAYSLMYSAYPQEIHFTRYPRASTT